MNLMIKTLYNKNEVNMLLLFSIKDSLKKVILSLSGRGAQRAHFIVFLSRNDI